MFRSLFEAQHPNWTDNICTANTYTHTSTKHRLKLWYTKIVHSHFAGLMKVKCLQIIHNYATTTRSTMLTLPSSTHPGYVTTFKHIFHPTSRGSLIQWLPLFSTNLKKTKNIHIGSESIYQDYTEFGQLVYFYLFIFDALLSQGWCNERLRFVVDILHVWNKC